MDDIVERLEAANEYCESSESKQLRKDAASEIRELRNQVRELNALMLRRASDKMSRRAA